MPRPDPWWLKFTKAELRMIEQVFWRLAPPWKTADEFQALMESMNEERRSAVLFLMGIGWKAGKMAARRRGGKKLPPQLQVERDAAFQKLIEQHQATGKSRRSTLKGHGKEHSLSDDSFRVSSYGRKPKKPSCN
jgi:hypothetical protein